MNSWLCLLFFGVFKISHDPLGNIDVNPQVTLVTSFLNLLYISIVLKVVQIYHLSYFNFVIRYQ